MFASGFGLGPLAFKLSVNISFSAGFSLGLRALGLGVLGLGFRQLGLWFRVWGWSRVRTFMA